MNRLLFLGLSLTAAATATGAEVILNEYNADEPPPGAVPGDWFEIVVVGSGIAGSTVDMRGWQFRIDNDNQIQQGYFRLSTASYWSNVQAGTIITFHEDNQAQNGVSTQILGTNNFATEGWAHTNIWTGDATYINLAAPNTDIAFPIDEKNTRITISRSNGVLVFGPAGEGHAGYQGEGVGDDEAFKLEANPSPSITLTSPYNAGSSSTFGAPNIWNQGANVQDFSAFIIPEPGTLLTLAGGAAILAGWRRRNGFRA